jgi:hypothetical protein
MVGKTKVTASGANASRARYGERQNLRFSSSNIRMHRKKFDRENFRTPFENRSATRIGNKQEFTVERDGSGSDAALSSKVGRTSTKALCARPVRHRGEGVQSRHVAPLAAFPPIRSLPPSDGAPCALLAKGGGSPPDSCTQGPKSLVPSAFTPSTTSVLLCTARWVSRRRVPASGSATPARPRSGHRLRCAPSRCG